MKAEHLLFLLNADIGEGAGNDEAILPLINAGSVACGGHTGDAASMKQACEIAAKNEVEVGAHPSFPDRANFGRVAIKMHPEALQEEIHRQVFAFDKIARSTGLSMAHLKLHGALYNLAAKDLSTTQLVLEALEDFKTLPFLAPWNSVFYLECLRQKRPVRAEGFADRRYAADLSLVPRKSDKAVISTVADSWDQVKQVVIHARITPVRGKPVPMKAETFCVHGDNPGAIALLKWLKSHQYG